MIRSCRRCCDFTVEERHQEGVQKEGEEDEDGEEKQNPGYNSPGSGCRHQGECECK